MKLDDLVESYFGQPSPSPLKNLQGLYEQVFAELLNEKENVDPGEDINIDIKFPKIRITEDFGTLGTEDRAIIEKFTRNIQGNTLQAKIDSLNNILTTKREDATVGEILSTMVVCEILSAIITNFTESAGGFIFEGFLAGLFGGESVQITSPEDIPGMDASGKPITDVILGGRHYSLKLLGQTTGVKGSFRNMVQHFKSVDHIVYLDARRVAKDQGLEFGEFTITLDNFLDVFVDPFISQVAIKEPEQIDTADELKTRLNALIREKKAIKAIRASKKFPALRNASVFTFSPTADDKLEEVALNQEDFNKVISYLFEMPDEELQEHAPFALTYAETKFEGTKAAKLFGSFGQVEQLKRASASGDPSTIISVLDQTPGYQEAQQFEFTRKQAEDIANFQVVGTLMIGPKYMKNTFGMYAELLQATISPVYEQLQFFTNNINDYFLGVSDETAKQDRKQYALNAIDNAKELEVATTNAVEKIEK